MKILELDLKKKVLIVDAEDFDYFENFKQGIYFKLENGDRDFIDGEFEYKCKGSELTEEMASELVDYWQNMANDGFIFENYKDNIPKKLTAIKSFISAVESKKFHWLENPIEIIERGEDTEHNRVLNQNEWQEAEDVSKVAIVEII